jgi:hypothetical protein
VTIDRSGWYAVRVKAEYGRHPIRRPFPFAATMPIWVTVNNGNIRSRSDAQHFIDWIDRTLARAMSTEGAWNNDGERQETRKLYGEARAKMIQRRDEAP